MKKVWLFLLCGLTFWWIYFAIWWLNNHYHKHYQESFSFWPLEKQLQAKSLAANSKKYLAVKNINITVVFPDLWQGKDLSKVIYNISRSIAIFSGF